MNELSLVFLYVVFWLSVVMTATGIVLTFDIKKRIKAEKGVKNGLEKLRTQLDRRNELNKWLGISTVVALLYRLASQDVIGSRYLITVMIFLHCLFYLWKILIDRKIWTQQYTPLNKRLHELFLKLEDEDRLKKLEEESGKIKK